MEPLSWRRVPWTWDLHLKRGRSQIGAGACGWATVRPCSVRFRKIVIWIQLLLLQRTVTAEWRREDEAGCQKWGNVGKEARVAPLASSRVSLTFVPLFGRVKLSISWQGRNRVCRVPVPATKCLSVPVRV